MSDTGCIWQGRDGNLTGHTPEGRPRLYEGGGFVSNSHALERSCLGLVQGVMGRLLAIGDPTLGASQGICLLTLSRLAVAELLPSPGALAPVGIKGCKGSSDIAPLISTPMSEGLAGK